MPGKARFNLLLYTKGLITMKAAFLSIIFLHGLIHLLGFMKAFDFAEISELTIPISRGWGLLWLTAAVTFLTAGILWIMKYHSWWIPTLAGIILSQVLIFSFWQDARFGTILNVLIFAVTIVQIMHSDESKTALPLTPGLFEQRYGSIENGAAVNFKLLNPFEIHIDPMDKLLLINIENDPDSIYIGFEPQVFDDDVNGTGMLVIGWRVDGKVDVYHQPGLNPDPEKYDIAGKGLANMVEKKMGNAFFDITEKGVQANISFTDIDGRFVELYVEERNRRRRKPFGLLAPMGDAAEQPSAMPLILLHEFYFVRRSNTDISVKINNRSHEPDKLPLPMDFSRMYFTRYSPDPLIVMLNPAIEGILNPLPKPGNNSTATGGTIYELTLNSFIYEIKSFSESHNEHTITVTFNPAFPNLDAFTRTGEATGSFTITGKASVGIVRGKYSVQNVKDQLQVVLIPSDGWIPNERKLSLRFLYTVAPIFRSWPTTYKWIANLQKDEAGIMYMKSYWERISND